jgi:Na+/melibiose symporter-like transporter
VLGALGDGVYYVTAALFFTTVVGLKPLTIGTVLSVAWLVAIALTLPAGWLVERLGPVRSATIAHTAAAAAVASYLLRPTIAPMLVAACLYATAVQTANGAQSALLARLVAGERRSAVRARVVSRVNAALALGAALGGLAIALDRDWAFDAAFAIDVASFLAAAIQISRLRDAVAVPEPAAGSAHPTGAVPTALAVIRDRPYLLLALLNVLLLLHLPLIDVALPLYVTHRTAAAHWAIAVVFLVNTAIVVVGQEWVAAHVPSTEAAVRRLPSAGGLLLAGCGVFALASVPHGRTLSTVLLMLAAVVMTFGEMVQTTSTGELSYGLAPAHSQGSYLNLFGSGLTVAEAVGPFGLTLLLVTVGPVGWLVLGAIFVAASIIMGHVAEGAAGFHAMPVPIEEGG